MAFSVEEMGFPVHYPNPELLSALTADSPMETPEKVKAVLGELKFPPAPADRPYLYGCMVLSFDGKMGFPDNPEGTLISKENRRDPIGGKTDFWIMNVCRAYADGVILGTGTLKARPSRAWRADLADPDLIAARRGLGKQDAAPLDLIVSIDGRDVPLEHPTLKLPERPVILTSQAGGAWLREHLDQPVRLIDSPCDLREDQSVLRVLTAGEEVADTAGLLSLLRRSGLSHVSVEAPGYIWQLIREELLDEYLLNYSGVMAGGGTALGTWAGQTAERHPHALLLSVGWHRGFLYTRQKLIYGDSQA